MYRKTEDMMWPAPCDRMNELAWGLRYGTLSKNDRIVAAEIITAYQQMISDPKKKRDMVVSELRKGPNIGLDHT